MMMSRKHHHAAAAAPTASGVVVVQQSDRFVRSSWLTWAKRRILDTCCSWKGLGGSGTGDLGYL